MHPDVMTNTANPRFIRRQYANWAREPGAMLEQWIDDQLGTGSFDSRYRPVMPSNWPANFTPPCGGEFGPGIRNNPSECTCSCRTEGPNGEERIDANQRRWAATCWAIRTSTDPRRCACPGLSSRGLAACFTREQRIQYHLWRLGTYPDSNFGWDGFGFSGTLGGLSREAIERSLRAGHAPGFYDLVRRQIGNNVPETRPRRLNAIRVLLDSDDNVNLLLEELETAPAGRE
jgi:hypothetical protein